MPVSIKTLTSKGFAGVKLVWTVDAESPLRFRRRYHPTCDILFVKINWGGRGKFYYVPLQVQEEIFDRLGRERCIRLPPLGTNPRGIEITSEALESLVSHNVTLDIDIEWKKESIPFNAYERWVQHWEND